MRPDDKRVLLHGAQDDQNIYSSNENSKVVDWNDDESPLVYRHDASPTSPHIDLADEKDLMKIK